MTASRLRRMRVRVLAAWFAQAAIGLGILLGAVVGAATGNVDWSAVAVMVVLLAAGLVAWVRFGFGVPLIVLDVLFALLGIGMGVVDPGGTAPADLVRRFVGGLWTIGGLAGAVALIASTGRGESATADVDTTAY
jgi:hypothetical protein